MVQDEAGVATGMLLSLLSLQSHHFRCEERAGNIAKKVRHAPVEKRNLA